LAGNRTGFQVLYRGILRELLKSEVIFLENEAGVKSGNRYAAWKLNAGIVRWASLLSIVKTEI